QQQIAVCGLPAVVFAVAVLPHGLRDWLLKTVGPDQAARVIGEGLANGTVPLRYWTIERHQKLIDGMISKELALWKHVENDTPPVIGWEHRRSCEAIKAAYPDAGDGIAVELDDELQTLWQQRQQFKFTIKTASEAVEKIDAQLFLRMQDAAVGVFPNGEKVKKVVTKETFVPGFTRKASSYLKGVK